MKERWIVLRYAKFYKYLWIHEICTNKWGRDKNNQFFQSDSKQWEWNSACEFLGWIIDIFMIYDILVKYSSNFISHDGIDFLRLKSMTFPKKYQSYCAVCFVSIEQMAIDKLFMHTYLSRKSLKTHRHGNPIFSCRQIHHPSTIFLLISFYPSRSSYLHNPDQLLILIIFHSTNPL